MKVKHRVSIIGSVIAAGASIVCAWIGGNYNGKETATQEIAQTMEVNINNEEYSVQVNEISEKYFLVKEELIEAENSIATLEKEREELLEEIARLEKSSGAAEEKDNTIESAIKKQDGEQENLMKICPPYDGTDYFLAEFTMSGETFSNGFYMRSRSSLVLINLKGEFSELSFDFGHRDGGGNRGCKLTVTLDDEELDIIDGKFDELYKNYTIDVSGVHKLQIELSEGEHMDYYGFANLMLVR